ncbi:5723_t:CDS:1, partial [Funneliformis caledonium]
QQCKDQNLPPSNYGACWVHNWITDIDPKLVPGDYDVWVHVYYCPADCSNHDCSMYLGGLYDCEKRYHVFIEDYK